MRYVTTSRAKQNFGEVLADAASEPIAVQRHRKVVGALLPPGWLERHEALDERRAARAAQRQIE